MATITSVHIDEKLPARIVRAHAQTGETVVPLTVRRFMGVMVHPVPAHEMQRLTDTFRPGGKIYVNWPETGWEKVVPGDQLEVGSTTRTIRAIRQYPGCYAELYVDQP